MFAPHGVIPALVTPLSPDGELLEDGLRNVIDYVIDGGVHGVFVLGSSGEFYGLSASQKRRVIEIAVEQTAGRVPVYAGASEITTRDAVSAARMAEEVGGVDALSVLTPFFMTPTQGELIEHYTAIAESTKLPVILYANPGRTNVHLELETVLELAKVPNIIGLKDSAGDLQATIRTLEARTEGFAVLMGRDTLILDSLKKGAEGAIASTGSVVPHIVSGIYDAFVAGDVAKAQELQDRLTPLRSLVDKATFPVVLKEALRIAGVDAGVCLAPARALENQYREQLKVIMADLTGRA